MSSKFIKSKESMAYKKRLKAFSQLIDPKQAPEVIEELKRKLIEKRGM